MSGTTAQPVIDDSTNLKRDRVSGNDSGGVVDYWYFNTETSEPGFLLVPFLERLKKSGSNIKERILNSSLLLRPELIVNWVNEHGVSQIPPEVPTDDSAYSSQELSRAFTLLSELRQNRIPALSNNAFCGTCTLSALAYVPREQQPAVISSELGIIDALFPEKSLTADQMHQRVAHFLSFLLSRSVASKELHRPQYVREMDGILRNWTVSTYYAIQSPNERLDFLMNTVLSPLISTNLSWFSPDALQRYSSTATVTFARNHFNQLIPLQRGKEFYTLAHHQLNNLPQALAPLNGHYRIRATSSPATSPASVPA